MPGPDSQDTTGHRLHRLDKLFRGPVHTEKRGNDAAEDRRGQSPALNALGLIPTLLESTKPAPTDGGLLAAGPGLVCFERTVAFVPPVPGRSGTPLALYKTHLAPAAQERTEGVPPCADIAPGRERRLFPPLGPHSPWC